MIENLFFDTKVFTRNHWRRPTFRSIKSSTITNHLLSFTLNYNVIVDMLILIRNNWKLSDVELLTNTFRRSETVCKVTWPSSFTRRTTTGRPLLLRRIERLAMHSRSVQRPGALDASCSGIQTLWKWHIQLRC